MYLNHFFFSCLMLLFGTLNLISSEDCVTFKLTNTPTITKENTNVTLTFNIISTCESELSVVAALEKDSDPPYAFNTLCHMIYRNGVCKSSSGCTCGHESQDYSVTGRVNGFVAEWALSVNLRNGLSFQESVYIQHEKSPPSIETITFHSGGKIVTSPISQNSSVTIVCTFDSGYPPMTSLPRLMGPRGQDIVYTFQPNGVNKIQHIMDNVQCENAGAFECEAENGTSRKSDTLLVKCEPRFAGVETEHFFVAPGGNLHLRFPVRSHSTRVELCELKEVLPDVTLIFTSCNSSDRSLSLIGSPPDMRLQLNLTNVTSQLHGIWTLGLGNDVGVGYLTFSINVTTDITTDSLTNLSVTTTSQTPSLGIIVGVVGALLLVIIAVVVVVVLIFLKRRGTGLPPPAPHVFRRVVTGGEGIVDVVFRAAPVLDENDDSPQNVQDHIYSEISDDDSDEASDDTASPEPDNDYLNPTASTAERATQNSAPAEVADTIHDTESSANEEYPRQGTDHEDLNADGQVQANDLDESKIPEENVEADEEEVNSFGVHSSCLTAEPPYENTVDFLVIDA